MTEYHKFLKNWTTERGITSFLGSDKPAFQQDWKDEKSAPTRFGERQSMGSEDINRAGKPFEGKYVESDLYSRATTKSEIEGRIANFQKMIDRITNIQENVSKSFFQARYKGEVQNRKEYKKKIDILKKRLEVLGA